uniref:Cytochrome P450 family 75 subfamily A polypeptide 110 n=1 Tax=Gloriosa superba TaxID=41220 RepID=A0A7D5QBW0_GLOSU|nr:cytochrome P450 family 75 subfamily A polypeptide 110 [Gloriosa superba]
MEVAVVLLFSAFLCLLLHRLLRRRRPSHLPLPPGPRGFPLFGVLPLLNPDILGSLFRLSKRYGPLMYLKLGNRGTLVVSSPAAARAIFTTADAHFANRPPLPTASMVTYERQDIIFGTYGPRWKLLRKLCVTHMLGARPLADSAPIRREEVGILLRSLHDSCDAPVVVPDALMSTVWNIMGRVLLSKRVYEDPPEFKVKMRQVLAGNGFFSVMDLVPVMIWLDLQGFHKEVRDVHLQFDAMISKMLADHAASAKEREGRPDFIDLVMQNRTGSDGETVSDVNIKGLILDMFTAGTDPAKVVTEWALAEMVSNPEIMKRAQSEIDQVVGKGRRLEEADLPSLPYLQAICKEAFRKFPPAPVGLPHCTFEACEVEGYYIPADTQLFVNLWGMGRDPDVWEEPMEFRPERFLSDGGRGAENNFELIPFGGGRRVCVGKQSGLLLVQYMLGSLVHSFDWRLPAGEKKADMEEKFLFSLSKAVPLTVLLSPRLAPSAYM